MAASQQTARRIDTTASNGDARAAEKARSSSVAPDRWSAPRKLDRSEL